MDDLISRQDVLDAIDKYILGKPEGDNVEVRELLKLITKVYRMPSAQPEPLTVNFAGEMDRETIEKLKESSKNAPVLIMAANDSAQPENVFEIGKPYPLKGFEFKIWKDAYGGDWVEIRKYQEPWKGEQDG